QALPPLFAALAGLHACHVGCARLADSSRMVPRMVELAELLPLPQTTLIAHAAGAWSCWNRGELSAAREHAARAIAAKPTEPISFPSTLDIVGYALGTAAFVELLVGDFAAARRRGEEALAWSAQTARAVDRATSLALVALLHAVMDDPVIAAARARDALAVAEEHGYRQWAAIGRIVAAWAATVAQPIPRRLARVISRIDEYLQIGLRGLLSAFLCLAAGAHIRGAKHKAGIELLDRAQAHVRDTGERWYEAELHRLRGAIVQAPEPRTGEAHFQHAIDIARAQGAKL